MKKATVFLLGNLMLAVPAWAAEAGKDTRPPIPAASDPAVPGDPALSSGEDGVIRAPAGKKGRVRYTFPSAATKRM